MKHFLIKTFWKRLIIGLLLISLAVALGFILGDSCTGPESSMTNRLIFIVSVIGFGFGGLIFIFLDWVGLLLGIGFVLVIALPQALPDPWDRYFSFLYLAALCGLIPLISWLKGRKKTTGKKSTKQNNSLRAKLRHLRTGLLIAIGAISLPWMFLNVPYRLFSALSLLPFPITLTVICLFPEDVSLDDKTSKKTSGPVDFLTTLTFSCAAPALRTLIDFNFLSWKPLLIQAGVLLVMIAVLLLSFCKELRQRVWNMLGVFLICIFFCVGAIGQLNYLLDTSDPQQQSAVITNMRISTSSKGPDRYYLMVITETGDDMDLMTSEDHYNSLSVGEEVTVYTKQGGLGVPYAIAD